MGTSPARVAGRIIAVNPVSTRTGFVASSTLHKSSDEKTISQSPTPQQATASTVALPLVMERIAFCESKNDPLAKNKHSTASGRFQIIRGTWNAYANLLWGDEAVNHSVFNFEDNTLVAMEIYKANGTRDWNSSRGCWGNF